MSLYSRRAHGGGCEVKTKRRMARFKGGWNYRGYCVYRVRKHWEMPDETFEECFMVFRTLAEFRRTVDKWEKRRAAQGGAK